jgi:hypothetical protein
MQFDALLGKQPDTTIARIFRVSTPSVWKRRTELGVATYGSKYGKLPTYNIRVFDNLDSTAAYWLGYHYADGCV